MSEAISTHPEPIQPDPEVLAVLQPKRKGKRWLIAFGLAALAGLGLTLALRGSGPPAWETVPVERGTLISTVTAVGQLEPLVSVDVGSDRSGTVLEVLVDVNDRVREGQVLARIDPAPYETVVAQQEAAWRVAKAAQTQAEVRLKSAKTDLARATQLRAGGAASPADLESAQLQADLAHASLRSAQAQLAQADASLDKARQDLDHTVIRAPIDGVVVQREVDPGQTVVSAFQATSMFALASDLTAMKAEVDVDEADVGQVAAGQEATFTVTGWPGRSFDATVVSVDLAPDAASNVVTYRTELRLSNEDLALRPGMTATALIEVGRLEGALEVPIEALRFRPEGVEIPAGDHVWILEEGELRALPVQPQASDTRHTAVEGEGLREGMTLVVGGGK